MSFGKELENKTAATYSLFVNAALGITVNDRKVQSALPTLGVDKRLTPARKLFKEGDVDVLIIVGVTPREDRRPHGWYVFCNGRMVLAADQSQETGWGDGLPQWHTKFRHFVGYVYFRSSDVRQLPWTTTKQGIVVDSPVYQAALSEMKLQARPVIAFLSNMYAQDIDEEDVPEREVLASARSTTVDRIRTDASFKADVVEERKRKENALVSIQYSRPRGQLDLIRQRSGDLRCLRHRSEVTRSTILFGRSWDERGRGAEGREFPKI